MKEQGATAVRFVIAHSLIACRPPAYLDFIGSCRPSMEDNAVSEPSDIFATGPWHSCRRIQPHVDFRAWRSRWNHAGKDGSGHDDHFRGNLGQGSHFAGGLGQGAAQIHRRLRGSGASLRA